MARTRTKVRLEHHRRGEVLFCEITLDGTKLTYVHGQRDTYFDARRGERFSDAAAAEAGLARRIEAERRAYPHREAREELVVEGEPAVLAPAASDPALEAAVITGGRDAASVYADWLQQHGDVRGELAALALAGQLAEVKASVAANPTPLLGDLDIALGVELYDLDWSGGFLTGASLRRDKDGDTDLAALTRAFLALPVARFVRRLRFGLASFESNNDWTPAMEAVASSIQAPHVTSLRFDDYASDDCELSWTPFGDFSAAWARLPALEELVIRSGAGGTLGTLDLPALRSFVRISGGIAASEIQAILGARWPALEKLEIWLGTSRYNAEATVELLAPLLGGRVPPALVHLGLRDSELVHELVPALAASPVTRKLRVLDLSMGALRDGDVDVVLAHADAFRHLARFDLSRNQLGAARAAEIRAVLPNADVGSQRDDDGDRYVAVGE